MYKLYANNFHDWRVQVRKLIALKVQPHDVQWEAADQMLMFGDTLPDMKAEKLTIPKTILPLIKIVAQHRSPQRWDLLYQFIWRTIHGEKNLTKIITDPLIEALALMEKSVRRDVHKAKAFVRFRKTEDSKGEHYIAWHQPDHYVLPIVAPFFQRRFEAMRWTILTPDASVTWDGKNLFFGEGVSANSAPKVDELEDLWKTYYRSIFNPARIKIKAMKAEMPVRYWATLPETEVISEILSEAPSRVDVMIKHSEELQSSAADFLPKDATLDELKAAAKHCKGCDLFEKAHQTVFGEGAIDAKLMLVGEQPGSEEDESGQPFVGPAGEVLNEALRVAEIKRENIYITNAVKHFRFVYRDSFREHRGPSRFHIQACKPWLNAEINIVQPQVIVCLGNTAARSLIGPGFTMKQSRGKWSGDKPSLIGSYHPSMILRSKAELKSLYMNYLIEDLIKAKLKASC